MDLARFIAAGLWLLAVVVVGWVSRRRLKRIDEERLAAAKDDDDGEDPVFDDVRRPWGAAIRFFTTKKAPRFWGADNTQGFVVFYLTKKRKAPMRASTRTLAARRPRGYNTYASIIAAQRRQLYPSL